MSIFEDLFVLEVANNHWGRLDRGFKIIDDFARGCSSATGSMPRSSCSSVMSAPSFTMAIATGKTLGI